MRTYRLLTVMASLALALLLCAPAQADDAAKDKGKPAKDKGKPAKDKGKPAKGKPAKDKGKPAKDPHAKLKVKVPRDKLPPLRSVRARTKQEAKDRSRKGTVKITITSSPKGAKVRHGNTSLGVTPFSITAKRGSTPIDVVVKRGGYMTLRTRVERKATRKYHYKLTRAKLR